MSASWHLEHRFQISAQNLAHVRAFCRPWESSSWVGDRRYTIHTFRGVPGKHVDVLLDPSGGYRSILGVEYQFPPNPGNIESAPWLLVCDIGRRVGKFDGKVRWRITLRDLQPMMRPESNPPMGRISVEEEGSNLVVVAHWRNPTTNKREIWAQEFPQFNWQPRPDTDYQGILLKQAVLWFGFLFKTSEDDIKGLALEWSVRPDVLAEGDINALNRMAERELYRLARDLGWRKLTLRERERLGLDTEVRQWYRADDTRLTKRTHIGGVGQYSLDAAGGATIHLPCGVCPQCQELLEDCGCVV